MENQNQKYDVIVIGGGVSGFSAALGACDQLRDKQDAKILVLEAGAGASMMAGGAWDVATSLSNATHDVIHPTKTLREQLQCFVEEHPYHPYAALGNQLFESVELAHEKVLDALGGYKIFDLDEHGVLVATEAGTLRRVATAQHEIADIEALHHGKVGVLDLPSNATYWAPNIASILSTVLANHETDVRFIPTQNKNASTSFEEQRQQAKELGAGSILYPPQNLVSDNTQESTGLGGGEVLCALSNTQGLRLKMRIDQALEKQGCKIQYGRVTSIQVHKKQAEIVIENGLVFDTQALVLATGKYIGGGIKFANGRVIESLAGLPIWSDGNLLELPTHSYGFDPTVFFGMHYAESGRGHRVGVGYDSKFRVLKEKGSPISSRLFAAGAVLSGFDPARDGTGFGCCATTGYFAGKNAASILLT